MISILGCPTLEIFWHANKAYRILMESIALSTLRNLSISADICVSQLNY